ncbi:hypothetical protein BJ138DRAFT_1116124 [Hygrophoropsis aurantiaca]|uniref:Uncharacterized protein n=1 Tax=Hygrophoropsis aurantiaca TaxID=72124 RepID=A0ACB8A4H5_9AGAM|nr:hypothetical protein BJ138DRAFT_1116124 [Hygrophoropsis aurantiaca]
MLAIRVASMDRSARSLSRASTPYSEQISPVEVLVTPPARGRDQNGRVTRSMTRFKSAEVLGASQSGQSMTMEKASRIPRLSKSPPSSEKIVRAKKVFTESADERELKRYKDIIRKITILRNEAILCRQCFLPSTKLYRTECGHSYCLSCIRAAFSACLEDQLAERDAPPELHAPFTPQKLKGLLEQKYIYAALYFCPACGNCQTTKPKKNLDLLRLTDDLTKLLGQPVGTAEEHVPPPTGKNIWAGIFVDEMDSDDESDDEASQYGTEV